jgi:hypothetical protein
MRGMRCGRRCWLRTSRRCGRGWAALPPASLRPRYVAETLHVVPIGRGAAAERCARGPPVERAGAKRGGGGIRPHRRRRGGSGAGAHGETEYAGLVGAGRPRQGDAGGGDGEAGWDLQGGE